ncbi:MAG: ASKHA domain-containing protein, partial [Candidatus Korarchaeum sp.]
ESSFISIGNSALAGAKSMLISKEAFDLANSLLAEIVHIELTGNHHFPDIFIEGLSLRRRA